jgi:3-oxoadipate enol-lactonase
VDPSCSGNSIFLLPWSYGSLHQIKITIVFEGRKENMTFAHVNATNLNYQFDGPEQGVVVMFSNSLAADITMWDSQVAPLIQAGYRVLRYDSRGHGHSAVPLGPYSLDLLAQDAIGLLDALQLDRVHFCGLSMGGMVGQLLGARYGDRLISLTLSSTAAHISPREIWDERIELVRRKGLGAVVDATIDRWFTKDGQVRLYAEVEKVRQMILNTSIGGYCACCEAIRDMDLRDSLSAVSSRVQVLVGEQDQGTPVSAAEFIHDRIDSSELKVIPHAAHFVNIEQSEAFNSALREFIARIDKGGA